MMMLPESETFTPNNESRVAYENDEVIVWWNPSSLTVYVDKEEDLVIHSSGTHKDFDKACEIVAKRLNPN